MQRVLAGAMQLDDRLLAAKDRSARSRRSSPESGPVPKCRRADRVCVLRRGSAEAELKPNGFTAELLDARRERRSAMLAKQCMRTF